MRLLIALPMAALLAACSTMNTIEQPADDVQVFDQILPGDTILIHLKGGRRFTMDVESVEKNAVSGTWPSDGKTYRVSFDRIVRVEREELSARETLLNIGNGYLIVCTVAAVALLALIL